TPTPRKPLVGPRSAAALSLGCFLSPGTVILVQAPMTPNRSLRLNGFLSFPEDADGEAVSAHVPLPHHISEVLGDHSTERSNQEPAVPITAKKTSIWIRPDLQDVESLGNDAWNNWSALCSPDDIVNSVFIDLEPLSVSTVTCQLSVNPALEGSRLIGSDIRID